MLNINRRMDCIQHLEEALRSSPNHELAALYLRRAKSAGAAKGEGDALCAVSDLPSAIHKYTQALQM